MKIRGQQLYVFSGERDNLSPIGCSTSCSLELSSNTVEGCRSASGLRKLRPATKGWKVTTDGFVSDNTFLSTATAAIGQPITIAFSVLRRELVEAGFDLSAVEPSAEVTLIGWALATATDYSARRSLFVTARQTFLGNGELRLLVKRGGFIYSLPLIFG